MSKIEYNVARGYLWKIEGNVATMQQRLTAPLTCAEQFGKVGADTEEIAAIVDAKNRGIKIVELWISKDGIELAKTFYAKCGVKFEIVREQAGSYFCQLLL